MPYLGRHSLERSSQVSVDRMVYIDSEEIIYMCANCAHHVVSEYAFRAFSET
jgi:hypothetical protein